MKSKSLLSPYASKKKTLMLGISLRDFIHGEGSLSSYMTTYKYYDEFTFSSLCLDNHHFNIEKIVGI